MLSDALDAKCAPRICPVSHVRLQDLSLVSVRRSVWLAHLTARGQQLELNIDWYCYGDVGRRSQSAHHSHLFRVTSRLVITIYSIPWCIKGVGRTRASSSRHPSHPVRATAPFRRCRPRVRLSLLIAAPPGGPAARRGAMETRGAWCTTPMTGHFFNFHPLTRSAERFCVRVETRETFVARMVRSAHRVSNTSLLATGPPSFAMSHVHDVPSPAANGNWHGDKNLNNGWMKRGAKDVVMMISDWRGTNECWSLSNVTMYIVVDRGNSL